MKYTFLLMLVAIITVRGGKYSPDIQAATNYVLAELRSMSYSGIFQTLNIQKIHSARTEKGVFHMNTFMTLEFKSPFLKTKQGKTKHKTPTSMHEVIVMKHLEDGKLSFAIDEFPEMDEKAVEKFWIESVEARRWVSLVA